jgi:small subunit ribosomal protein S7
MEQKNQKNHKSIFFSNSRIIHFLMKNGKKSKAEFLFRKALDIVQNPHLFQIAIQNVQPIFEIQRVRISGVTREVPCLVPFQRQEGLALRWILQATRERKRKNSSLSFQECLATEILEASKSQGIARQKRDQLHKTAEANRAFAHLMIPR